jgi:hypothetical protein
MAESTLSPRPGTKELLLVKSIQLVIFAPRVPVHGASDISFIYKSCDIFLVACLLSPIPQNRDLVLRYMEMAMFPHIQVQIDGYFPSCPMYEYIELVTDPVTQGVTKSLSWLTSSAHACEPKCGGRGELRGLSQ